MATKVSTAVKPDEARLQQLLSLKKPWLMRDKAASPSSSHDCVPCGGSADHQSNELYKQFKFRNFREAWQFMTKVADEAERLNHHPEWANVYNRVDVTLTTHSANSTVTSLDVDLAEQCESAAAEVIQARPPKK